MTVNGGDTSTASVFLDNTLKFVENRVIPFERIDVIAHLPQLYTLNPGECHSQVLPLIEYALGKENNSELHSAAAASYLELINSNSVTSDELLNRFLPLIVPRLESFNAEILDVWLPVLLDVFKLLPTNDITTIANQAMEKCRHDKTRKRCGAVRILGGICAVSDKRSIGNLITSEVWPVVHSLCHDGETVVRVAVCQQLPFIAPALDEAHLNRSLIPCLTKLAEDENEAVKSEVLESCVKLAATVPVAVLRRTLQPLFLSVAKPIKNLKVIRPISVRLATNIAPFWITLQEKGLLDLTSRAEIADIFHKLVADSKLKKDSNKQHCLDIRRICAEIFLLFFRTKNYEYSKTLNEFVTDPDPQVRKIMAISLSKGADRDSAIRPLTSLLRDTDESVLATVLDNLSSIVNQLCATRSFGAPGNPPRKYLAEGILVCGQTISNSLNWRLIEQYYLQLPCVIGFLSPKEIFGMFYASITQQILVMGPLPIGNAACRALLLILRTKLSPSQRQEIRNWLRVKLLMSNSCYDRLQFLNASQTALEFFSMSYFNRFFLKNVLTLKDDPVVNVRLALAMQLPKLLAAADVGDNADLVLTVWKRMLAKETDRDVREALSVPQVQNGQISLAEEAKRKAEEAQ